jgi:tripartite-type tricarboxylate transporter receptor subunit TctC
MNAWSFSTRPKVLGALGVLASACLLAATPFAQAQQAKFPSKPIRLIAPFAPGGALDLVARTAAQVISEQLGQPVVVENRAGAAGAIGSEFVARAPADGYTLLLGATTTHGINPMLQKLPYDALKDFAPVSLVATIPHIIVVNPQLPVNTIQEFIAYAKAKPGLTYGSAGTGSPHHLAGEMLKMLAGVDVVHVPYKGSGPAMSDLIGGQIQFMSIEYTAAVGNIKGGKLKALAVATPQRVPGIDLPTLAEAGLQGFEVTAWYAIYAPAGTPQDIVAALQGALAKGIRSGDARDKLASLNATAIGSTPEALGIFMRADMERWGRVIKAANVKPE